VRFGTDYEETRRLADGTPVRLRLLRPDDRAKLLAGFGRLSDESRYARFFTAMPRLSETTLDRLLATDGLNHLAIAAEAGDQPPETAEGLGVARFIRLPEAPDVAEAAVAVVDHMQHRGLGTLLLARLAAAARERGIRHFRAEVMRTNQAMVSLLHGIDADAHPTYEGSVAIYDLAVPEDTRAEDRPEGPLFGMLRLAASGLQVVLRRLHLTDDEPAS
jgi:GNAT superfamily N-acetyltransferase